MVITDKFPAEKVIRAFKGLNRIAMVIGIKKGKHAFRASSRAQPDIVVQSRENGIIPAGFRHTVSADAGAGEKRVFDGKTMIDAGNLPKAASPVFRTETETVSASKYPAKTTDKPTGSRDETNDTEKGINPTIVQRNADPEKVFPDFDAPVSGGNSIINQNRDASFDSGGETRACDTDDSGNAGGYPQWFDACLIIYLDLAQADRCMTVGTRIKKNESIKYGSIPFSEYGYGKVSADSGNKLVYTLSEKGKQALEISDKGYIIDYVEYIGHNGELHVIQVILTADPHFDMNNPAFRSTSPDFKDVSDIRHSRTDKSACHAQSSHEG